MSKLKVTTIFIALLALSASFGLGQMDDDGYNSFSPTAQGVTESKDVPAGFVNEPGSQLLYLLDTGINAEELYGADVDYTSNSVLQYGHAAPEHTNFISMTNTNPSHAVTVHFRYFNSDCVDFFDFLVVLTCNDTMMVNPFDFVVPGTAGVNVKDRFFGYPDKADGNGQSFNAIPASTFSDGRFLLFVTASADVKEGYDPDIYWGMNNGFDWYDYGNMDLIPYEFINYREEELNMTCSAWENTGGGGDPIPGGGTYSSAGESLFGVFNAYGNTPGFSDRNLHILNASATSFNFLIGFQTVAKVTDLGAQAAYMTQAGTRPAIVANVWDWQTSITGGPSGVGAKPAPIHVLLTGGEVIDTEAAQTGDAILQVDGKIFMLRQEAHAGDQWDRGPDVIGTNWIISEGGALGWEIFSSAAMPAENQIVNFFSFMDNYNGHSNLALGATPNQWDDVSYNIQPVVTIYIVTPYNNSEDTWIPGDPEDQPIVSPVTPESPLTSAIAVKCINTYQIDPETNLNDAVLGEKFGEFKLQDLYDINSVLGTGNKTLEQFLAIITGSANEITNEVGPGWIRFSRYFTTRKWTTTLLNPTYITQVWHGWDATNVQPLVEGLMGPSIFTAGQANYVFENFGAGKWLSTVASVSTPVPNRVRLD